VLPARLSAAGFHFEYPELGAALREVLSPPKE
jgi:NAD dependent epimerase/dehydratase family enzyme